MTAAGSPRDSPPTSSSSTTSRSRDKATFAKPSEPSIGMKHVLVNGAIVLDNGRLTSHRPGRILRGPGHK